jgi:hypothetical protein
MTVDNDDRSKLTTKKPKSLRYAQDMKCITKDLLHEVNLITNEYLPFNQIPLKRLGSKFVLITSSRENGFCSKFKFLSFNKIYSNK